MRRAVIAVALAAARALAAQDVPPDRARIAEAVRADLTRLSELERTYFIANRRFTTDVKGLRFVPASGATVTVSYASARTFSASASHPRLAPFICFVIVSGADAGSPAERPFCADSRFGTAASSLARSGGEMESPKAPARRAGADAPAPGRVTPVTSAAPEQTAAKPAEPAPSEVVLTTTQFAERLRVAATSVGDSSVVVVQFAVRDARYDPSRGILEVAVERVPVPLAIPPSSDAVLARPARPAIACFTRPAFVCGAGGLSFVARDVFRVSPSRAPGPEVLRAGLTLHARFSIGRRDDTPGPALTLLALLLQANGESVARWEPTGSR